MNVNRNNTGDFYRNRSNTNNGQSSLAAAVFSDLNQQQQRLLGGLKPFSVSARIAALAAGGIGAQNTTDGGAAAAAAAAALSSLGKIEGGTNGEQADCKTRNEKVSLYPYYTLISITYLLHVCLT